ncbi:MAG: tol-pal system-associated acyl-CoA thioesterase [Gammaproteobacteria bacterium]|nr:tol-pal system-associated acyl-CoA thioesterase [Gammaproteobacteria bacterium]
MQRFVLPVRVYYEDTDAGGVVYHANYVRFMERARTEYLRQLGFEQCDLMQRGVVFAVRSMQLDFLKPAKLDDLLKVDVEIQRLQRVSVTFLQTVSAAQNDDLFCRAEVKVVCIAHKAFRPSPIPEPLMEAFRR